MTTYEQAKSEVRAQVPAMENGHRPVESVKAVLASLVAPVRTTEFNGWQHSGSGPEETVFVFEGGVFRTSVQNSWEF